MKTTEYSSNLKLREMSREVVNIHVHVVITDCIPELRKRKRGIRLTKNAVFTANLVYEWYQWVGRGRSKKLEIRGHDKIKSVIRRLDE